MLGVNRLGFAACVLCVTNLCLVVGWYDWCESYVCIRVFVCVCVRVCVCVCVCVCFCLCVCLCACMFVIMYVRV